MSILCLNIGNTHINGGVFQQATLLFRFCFPSKTEVTGDVFGLFLQAVLRENGIDPRTVTAISISSVVPRLNRPMSEASKKYFNVTPLFIGAGSLTNITLAIDNPQELGADRIANAVAAVEQFPGKNLAIFDFGTATTACAITQHHVYIGGAIWPGILASMRALSVNTALLPDTDMCLPDTALGKNTVTQLHAGLYYSQIGAVKELLREWQATVFAGAPAWVLATGGDARLFQQEIIFDAHLPDLTLQGLRLLSS